MKKIATILLCLIVSLSVTGQTQLFSGQQKDSVVRINPQMQKFDFVPGEVLVKFRDGVTVNFKNSRKGLKSSQAFMNRLINKYGIVDGERLFPNEKRLKSVQILTAPNGYKFKRPSLNNIYKLKLNSNDPRQLHESIRALKADSAQVVYAEPNYILSIVGDKPESPVMTEKQAEQWIRAHPQANAGKAAKINTVTPNDPLYSQQWGIPATQVNQVWDSTTGDTTQIIGILDTGVDWKHPDLKDNIWKNPGEIPGNGIDDDGDGYIDDVRGWDFVNHDNNPMDDNGHGTHVAGIAAAEGNNGIGIAGVDWHAKIMPVKVFHSNGKADVATIIKGIIYAANHGATVINMSFGSYIESSTMDAALLYALPTTVLVAAAGNDDYNINSHGLPIPTSMFPGALPYVLGVQATYGQILASFSNYDPDGPVYSESPEGLNYELAAPGAQIMSTFPGGNYRFLSGTSMATPLVCGSVALYKSKFPYKSNETLWGDLIHSSSTLNIDVYSAMFNKSNKKPILDLVSYSIIDKNVDNNNNQAYAGDTIALLAIVKNSWSQGDSCYAQIKFSSETDSSGIEIINNINLIGSIGTYAQKQTPSFIIKIKKDVPDGRNVKLNFFIWCQHYQDTTVQSINFKISNGILLSGVMDSTLTLTPNRKWIVNNSFKIGNEGHLVLMPGTQLELNNYIINNGLISGTGTKDSIINISGNCIGGTGTINLQFGSFNNMTVQTNYIDFNDYRSNDFSGTGSFVNCSFTGLDGFYNFGGNGPYSFKSCSFQGNTARFMFAVNSSFTDCEFNRIYTSTLFFGSTYNFIRCNFNSIGGDLFRLASGFAKYCNFSDFHGFTFDVDSSNFSNNIQSPDYYASNGDVTNLPNNYWGTTDSARISKYYIYDFWDDPALSMVNFKPFLIQPSDSAHGFVWKILVDGIDPQDQAKLMNPVGVGVHRFDVYFNRPMDTAYTPHLSFGVRYPYNQQTVADSGHWSHNNTVWTAYKTIKLYTGDGENTLRVSGTKDLKGFEIPVEESRFIFVISAAQSSSLDFMATPGLGKVALEWNSDTLTDLMGFNMYRMEQLNDTTLSQPVLVNNTLIIDTLFTDYNVIPNKKYYYFYKVVRTDFSESDSSRVVAATPFTAALGDANGDLKVNILDLTSIVAYILGKNPQPFIKAAADVNGDSTINVLDIISIVKLILGTKETTASNSATATPATIRMNDSTIQLESDHQLAALQFELKGDSLNQVKLSLLLKGFEFSYGIVNGKLIGLVYSFTGNMIPGGLQNIIKIDHAPGELKWGKVFGSDIMGKYVEVTVETVNGMKQPIILKNGLMVSPNPFNTSVVLKYLVSKRSHVQIEVYNLNGQKVSTLQNSIQNTGKYEIVWHGKTGGNRLLPSGIYFCRMFIVPENGGPAFKKDVKLVKMR